MPGKGGDTRLRVLARVWHVLARACQCEARDGTGWHGLDVRTLRGLSVTFV